MRVSSLFFLLLVPCLGAIAIDTARGDESFLFPLRQTVAFWNGVEDAEVLSSFGRSSKKFLPNKSLRIITWNIQKGSTRGWLEDLTWLNEESDLLMVQEAVLDRSTGEPWNSLPGKSWNVASSFFVSLFETTGVVMGATVQNRLGTYLRSPDVEPFTRTHKMALVGTFPLETRNCLLLAATVHGINFTIGEEFSRQMQALVRVLSKHSGPIIVAGDFNTWSPARRIELAHALRPLGLTHLRPAGDIRLMALDHVFVRGFEAKSSALMSAVTSSDHYPLFFELDLLPNCGGKRSP